MTLKQAIEQAIVDYSNWDGSWEYLEMRNMENYTDHNGNVFMADHLLSCPFCGAEAEILFTGNRASKSRKAIIKCTNKMCRAEMTNATMMHDTEWVAKISIEAWNNRSKPNPMPTQHPDNHDSEGNKQ